MTREEAIQTVKTTKDWGELRLALQELVPELAESEDERIRKDILRFLKAKLENCTTPTPAKSTLSMWINYLEKQKEQKSEQYSPLCNTVKDKIREYIANHFVADTVVKTDVKSIVKAMEEGVRLGKEECCSPEWSEEDERMWKSALWHIKNSCGNGGKNSGEFEVYQWFKNRVKSLRTIKQEWSEEDKKNLKQCIEIVRGWEIDFDYANPHYSNWLKSFYIP